MIADLNQSGTTIFLTTHYIEEAERLCHRIAFIVSGRIVRTDTVADLMQPIQDKHVMSLFVDAAHPNLCEDLASSFPHFHFEAVSNVQVRVESTEPVKVGPLVRFLEERGVEVVEAKRVRPSLEDVFVRITGIEAEAMKKEKEKRGGGA